MRSPFPLLATWPAIVFFCFEALLLPIPAYAGDVTTYYGDYSLSYIPKFQIGIYNIDKSIIQQQSDAVINVGASTANTLAAIELGANSNGSRYSYIDFHGDDTYTDFGLRLLRGNGGANTWSELTHRGTGDFVIGGYDSSTLKLTTNNTPRLTIDSSGQIGINTTPQAYRLSVFDDVVLTMGSPKVRLEDTALGWSWELEVSSATPPTSFYVQEYYDATHMFVQMGGLTSIGNTAPSYLLEVNGSAGKPGGGSWSNSSDRRLKKNIEPLTGALEVLRKLQPVRYEWVNPEEHSMGVHAGFIAQDVEQVFPDWVGETDPDGADSGLVGADEKIKTLYFPHDFNAYAVETIRELRAEKDALSERKSTLEHELWTIKELVCLDHPDADVCNR